MGFFDSINTIMGPPEHKIVKQGNSLAANASPRYAAVVLYNALNNKITKLAADTELSSENPGLLAGYRAIVDILYQRGGEGNESGLIHELKRLEDSENFSIREIEDRQYADEDEGDKGDLDI